MSNNHPNRGRRSRAIVVRMTGTWVVCQRTFQADPDLNEPAFYSAERRFSDADLGSQDKAGDAAIAYWRKIYGPRRPA